MVAVFLIVGGLIGGPVGAVLGLVLYTALNYRR